MATPVYSGQNFFAPQFMIKLQGQNLGHEVVRDVLQVSYKDDLDSLDSFEFTLHDWDPVTRTTKYSSPYDETGALKKIRGTSFDVPNFEPGARVDLYMGYYGAEDPILMMSGKVMTASASFPASGNPTVTVKVMNLLHDLQRSQESLSFEEKTPSQIAGEIASNLDIPLDSSGADPSEAPIPFIGMNNEYPILFLSRLARKMGYDLFVNVAGDEPQLFFGLRQNPPEEYELEWGKSLISFTPTLKLKDQKEKVVVRGWNAAASGADRAIEAEASWSDLEITMPDSKLLEQVQFASENAVEEITDQPVPNVEAAEIMAKGALRRIVQGVITGAGSSVGLPTLRAGTRLSLKGLGLRYSYKYIVTESSHKIDGSGYITDFTARMEVVSG